MISRAALFLGLMSLTPLSAVAQGVQFIGTGYLDGRGTDRSGLPSALLEDGVSPMNGLNGIGSGMTYTGYQNRFVLLPDRGPNKVEYKGGAEVDFTTSYANRIQSFDIKVVQDPGRPTGWRVDLSHVGTTLLKNAANEQYIGISTAFANDGKPNRRLDSEGVGIAPDGTIWISDEYGPHILQFDQTGKQIGRLPAPEGFEIATPGPNLKTEMQINKVKISCINLFK
jgi:outer membrane protein assembly factor BamB